MEKEKKNSPTKSKGDRSNANPHVNVHKIVLLEEEIRNFLRNLFDD